MPVADGKLHDGRLLVALVVASLYGCTTREVVTHGVVVDPTRVAVETFDGHVVIEPGSAPATGEVPISCGVLCRSTLEIVRDESGVFARVPRRSNEFIHSYLVRSSRLTTFAPGTVAEPPFPEVDQDGVRVFVPVRTRSDTTWLVVTTPRDNVTSLEEWRRPRSDATLFVVLGVVTLGLAVTAGALSLTGDHPTSARVGGSVFGGAALGTSGVLLGKGIAGLAAPSEYRGLVPLQQGETPARDPDTSF